jgi:lycopene cyclase domain-containing protein
MYWLYAAFNVFVFAGPFLGTLVWLRSFWIQWRQLMLAWLTVSMTWIVLDILSVARGWWGYNQAYFFGPKLGGLPLEEVAFFFTVPFACLVVYWVMQRHVRGGIRRGSAHMMVAAVSVVLIGIVVGNIQHERTVFDCLLALAVMAFAWRLGHVYSRLFWYWNGVVFICCLLFDAILTAPPIIIYAEPVMSGWRLGSVPIEDVIYNFSLLNLFVLAALHGRPRVVQDASQPAS